MAGTAPFASVIIPAYNAAEIIDGALNAILNQIYPKDKFEVIVMNGRSSDKTREVASQYQVTVISHGRNLGPGLFESALACALPRPNIYFPSISLIVSNSLFEFSLSLNLLKRLHVTSLSCFQRSFSIISRINLKISDQSFAFGPGVTSS